MRISDWSSDVCSSDLVGRFLETLETEVPHLQKETARIVGLCAIGGVTVALLVVLLYGGLRGDWMAALLAGVATAMSLLPEEFPVVLTIFRSEEHTSELQSLMRISYAVFCLKKKKTTNITISY